MLLRGKSGRAAGSVLGLLAGALAVWVLAHGGPGPAQALHPPAPAAAPAESAIAPRVGMAAPDFALTDVNTGTAVRLTALRGRPVWINFWATWCEECKTELPIMTQVYARYRSRSLAIVGVDVREDAAQVRAYTTSHGVDWMIVIDADGGVRNRYNTVGIPYHLFIDARGLVQAVTIGAVPADVLQANLAKILAP